MLYKGQYGPSDLLDPETYDWNPLDQDLKKLLSESKYVCPSATRAREQTGENKAMSETNEGVAKDMDGTEEEEHDEDESPGFVFESKMPGILTVQQLKAFDIGNVKIKVGKVQAQAKVIACAQFHLVVQNIEPDRGTQQDLVGFENLSGLHTIFRETVATVGMDVAREMVVVLR